MSGPTTRVLATLELLQAQGRLSGAELAHQLGVDRRTVRRYITVLEDLGIPVMTEQGRYGGYALVAGFKLPPMMFTEEETLAVALGLLAARQLGLAASAPAIASAEAKLERVMPSSLKRRVRGVSDTTRVILPRGNPSLDARALLVLTAAADRRQGVTFTYHGPDKPPMERRIDPYGLVFRQGRWYVIGHCHLREALRSFRLDRISDIATLANTFERPEGFDAAIYLNESLQNWKGMHPVTVVFHANRTTVADVFGFEPECADPLEQVEDGLLFRTSTDCFDWFAWWLAQLPFRFTIADPPELRAALRAHAERLLETC